MKLSEEVMISRMRFSTMHMVLLVMLVTPVHASAGYNIQPVPFQEYHQLVLSSSNTAFSSGIAERGVVNNIAISHFQKISQLWESTQIEAPFGNHIIADYADIVPIANGCVIAFNDMIDSQLRVSLCSLSANRNLNKVSEVSFPLHSSATLRPFAFVPNHDNLFFVLHEENTALPRFLSWGSIELSADLEIFPTVATSSVVSEQGLAFMKSTSVGKNIAVTGNTDSGCQLNFSPDGYNWETIQDAPWPSATVLNPLFFEEALYVFWVDSTSASIHIVKASLEQGKISFPDKPSNPKGPPAIAFPRGILDACTTDKGFLISAIVENESKSTSSLALLEYNATTLEYQHCLVIDTIDPVSCLVASLNSTRLALASDKHKRVSYLIDLIGFMQ